MPGEVDVGGIVVRLIADAKQLEAALSKGSADFRKFGSEADKASKTVQKSADETTKAITAVVSRIGGMVAAYVSVNTAISAFNNAISNVTALDHLSQATGASVERLSELRNIAIATGVDFETVGRAFAQFGARMTEALASSTSKGSQALRALSIDVRDAQGNIRQLDDVLPELADKFSQFANGSNKAALASAIFGEEAGPKMLALLNRGKAGLDEIRRTLGGTYTTEDAERVRSYREALASLQVVFEKAVVSMARMLDEFNRARGGAVHGAADAVDRLTKGLEAQERRVAELTETMERRNRAFGRASQSDQEDLERAKVRLEQLRQELAAEQALAAMRGGSYNQRNAPPLPQAPAMDPFALEKAQIALEQIMDRLSGQRDIFDSINLSWQEHADVVQRALAAIDRASDQKFRAEAARHRFAMQQRRAEQDSILAVATQAAQTITALWPKQKGAAIAAAIINTAVGVTNALRTGVPPWNFAQAALIAAAGAAQIASIRSTNETGASGGSSTPVAPQEPVVEQSRSLNITGVDPGALFSGGQVRGLIELINEEVKNGATLISSGRLAA
jgi:hypothetical protein